MKSARVLTDYFSLYVGNRAKQGERKEYLNIEAYRGENACVYEMSEFLLKHLKGDLLGAYVHGSIATGEEILYSDFDGLVILRKEVVKSPERLKTVAKQLTRSNAIFYRYDPLQHHGWFVLTEQQLESYPEHFLPIATLRFAKAILPIDGSQLILQPYINSDQSRIKFNILCESVVCRAERNQSIRNMYQLKSLLSQFMLIPSLYIQSKTGKGVFKRDSFLKARVDFTAEDWAIMDDVSKLRETWHYQIGSFRHKIMCIPSLRLFTKRLAPTIPPQLREKLTPAFFMRMARLVRNAQARLI